MVAPGAKGSFPSSTDDATKPKNIIALSNPHTRTTGFQGMRIRMAEPPGRRTAHDYLYYTAKNRRFLWTSCQTFSAQELHARSTSIPGSRDGGKLKPFPACCVLLSPVDRLVMLKLWIKLGVSALALILVALPVAACVLPGAAMTSAERECCKKMAGQCGDMGMAKSHPCCKVTASRPGANYEEDRRLHAADSRTLIVK
jgi:hypothetical protein